MINLIVYDLPRERERERERQRQTDRQTDRQRREGVVTKCFFMKMLM